MIFGIVKESLEKWIVFVHDIIILWYPKKSDFQELPWHLSIFERFRVRTVCNVTPIQGLQNDMFMKTELLAGDVRQKLTKSHSRWGGVAKVRNRIPTLHASQKKKTTPRQHGSAKSDFFDTSSARMLVWKMYKFLLLWILVDLGSQ